MHRRACSLSLDFIFILVFCFFAPLFWVHSIFSLRQAREEIEPESLG